MNLSVSQRPSRPNTGSPEGKLRPETVQGVARQPPACTGRTLGRTVPLAVPPPQLLSVSA